MSHISHWPVCPLFGVTACYDNQYKNLSLDKKKQVKTRSPSREQSTSLTLKLVTNTDAER